MLAISEAFLGKKIRKPPKHIGSECKCLKMAFLACGKLVSEKPKLFDSSRLIQITSQSVRKGDRKCLRTVKSEPSFV
jgi:hypothetical protein